MTPFSSLSNRIFFATALLAVVSIATAVYLVNVSVSGQAENELRRGLGEAATIIEEYRRVLVEHSTREARLVADLPRLKAAVDTDDPETVQKVAEEYQRQLAADLLVITRHGRTLALIDAAQPATPPAAFPRVPDAAAGRETSAFWPHEGGILQVVSVPIWIDPRQPEILGTLSVGFTLDDRAARRFRSLTDSDVAFGANGQVRASTLPKEHWPALVPLLARDGVFERVALADEAYIASTHSLSAGPLPTGGAADDPAAKAIILRSRTERLSFLESLHRSLGIIAVLAVLVATLLSYAIARTVTHPLAAITATMREMSATGDLTRRISLPSGRAAWQDEDARLLAGTFNSMTDSIGRFQRDAAQRDRLSSLGRLSTVVAHEVRNPLMIIKTALRTLRSPSVDAAARRTAVDDIDEETARLNRLVSGVLDFARPIKFELATTDLNALCEDAARAAGSDPDAAPIRLSLDPAIAPIVTDPERLRMALVNILTNARHAVAGRADTAVVAGGADAAAVVDPIRLTTERHGARVIVSVQDRGTGIATADLPHVFDPYFTTRRTGTGLGLAITRNIVEGLGGAIVVSSVPGQGTEVRLELNGDL